MKVALIIGSVRRDRHCIKDKLLDRKQGSQLMDLLKAAKLNVIDDD